MKRRSARVCSHKVAEISGLLDLYRPHLWELVRSTTSVLARGTTNCLFKLQDQLQNVTLSKDDCTDIYAHIRANIKKLDPTIGTWVKNTIDGILFM